MTMETKLKVICILSVVGVMASFLTQFNVQSDTAAAQSFDVVARGLDNPRGLTFGPEGALYVVEAGRGGDTCTNIELFGGIYWVGLTGAVTRIWKGQQERIATGLSSAAHPDGGFAFGPHSISFQGKGGADVTVGGCFALEDVGGGCGRLIHLKSKGSWESIADLSTYEILYNPDGAHKGERVILMPCWLCRASASLPRQQRMICCA